MSRKERWMEKEEMKRLKGKKGNEGKVKKR